MILVVGATGSMGTILCKRLRKQGKSVRGMTRTPEKASVLEALGVEIVAGDLRDKASLQRACVGVDQVVATAHSILGRGQEASKYVDLQGHKALIDAAKSVGVRRFVYLSALGVGSDSKVSFFQMKYEVEQYLRGSGLPFVILRPTAFIESHAHLLIGEPILQKGKVSLFGRGENPRNFVAAADVAHFAQIGLDDETIVGQTIAVGGPEDWTNMQVVALYEKLAACQAKVSHVPLGVLRVMSVLLRPFHPGLSQIMQMSIMIDTTDQTLDMTETLQTYPFTLTHLEDWIQDYAPSSAVSATGAI